MLVGGMGVVHKGRMDVELYVLGARDIYCGGVSRRLLIAAFSITGVDGILRRAAATFAN